ncbi:MAG TPA: hypothetical protein VH247_04095 [Thermoleophilaceae bacterium]|nr:hypothetical protein [Thermoleophilaceae bacterium]
MRRGSLAGLVVILSLVASATAHASFQWGTPQAVDPDYLTNSFVPAAPVSCASSTFCMSVGSANTGVGKFVTYNGTSWSAPASVSGSSQLLSVSCVSTTFCAVGDSNGNVFTYDGTSWSAATSADALHAIVAMSCVSTTLCVGAGYDGTMVTFTGTGWSTKSVDPDNGLAGVSCGTATFCVAVDVAGNAFTSADPADGSSATWTGPVDIDSPNSITGISCVSATFCAAVDHQGNALTYNGTIWSSTSIDASHHLTSVGCASSTLCLAGDDNGSGYLYNGATWSATPVSANKRGIDGADCATGPLCVAIAGPNAFVYTGTWSSPEATGSGGVGGISCVTTTFCVAADGNGSVLKTIDGNSWTLDRINGENHFNWISCAATNFCAAVDTEGQFGVDGNALTFNGVSWTKYNPPIDQNPGVGGGLVSVSCPSPTFCAAVDFGGHALTYNNGSWSAPDPVATAVGFYAVACASSTFCAAADTAGNIIHFNGSSWESPVPVDQGEVVYWLSCPTSSFCAAVDGDGAVLMYNGSTWSAPQPIDTGNSFNTVSCPTTNFCAATDIASNVFTYNGQSWSGPVHLSGVAYLGGISCLGNGVCYGTTNDGVVRGHLPPPANAAAPAISGAATAGEVLTEAHGTWSNDPGTFAYEWQRCDGSGTGCSAISGASAQTYTLTGDDVGHTIRVRETAANVAGSDSATSGATAVVQSPPATPPSSSPPAGGSETPSSGGNPIPSVTTPTATAAQILASLVAQLAPKGKIGAILKAGGYRFAFKALASGAVGINWYFVPKGARLAKAMPILVASGKTTFAAVGSRQLKVKLTAAGKRLLKKARRIKLTAKGNFVPTGGRAITGRRSFTLKR